jgi:hypothetical protein
MNGFEKKRKVGRNDPCPCGSGKKFKKCHGGIATQFSSETQPPDPEELKIRLEQIKALQKQREQQQGLGRPIISTVFHGQRIVAVGSKIFYSPTWKTFHDFLFYYSKTLFGSDWGNAELKKSPQERHPILNWYYTATSYMNSFVKERGKVQEAPTTGAAAAYLGLAYDLYCLEHNAKVHGLLLKRLKSREQFYGAYYETLISGALVRAGFDIEFEDETDSKTSHCELTATFRKTGKKFSVEAKMRLPDKSSVDVGNQLYEALKKNAAHTRLVFIEVNIPDDADDKKTVEVLGGVLKSLRSREEKLTIAEQPAPPAYVVVTNNPYHYNPNAPCRRWGLVEGFKMPDFKFGDQCSNLRDALNLREKHQEILSLMKSMLEHADIPSTFDGEMPEFAFGSNEQRLIVGNNYLLPDGKGGEVVGELQHAVVMETEKKAHGIYKLPNGQTILASCPLTDDELAAYHKYPDTFFGVYKPHTNGIHDPLELYDFLLDFYSKTPKEILLGFLKNAQDYQQLQNLTQKELAAIYCERLVYGIMNKAGPQHNHMTEIIARVVAETSSGSVGSQGK